MTSVGIIASRLNHVPCILEAIKSSHWIHSSDEEFKTGGKEIRMERQVTAGVSDSVGYTKKLSTDDGSRRVDQVCASDSCSSRSPPAPRVDGNSKIVLWEGRHFFLIKGRQ